MQCTSTFDRHSHKRSPRDPRAQRFPLLAQANRGIQTVHMSRGFGADACTRMLADLRSPPNARHLGRWPRACTPTPHGTRHLRRAYGCCAPRAFPSRRLPCWATLASPSALTHPTRYSVQAAWCALDFMYFIGLPARAVRFTVRTPCVAPQHRPRPDEGLTVTL